MLIWPLSICAGLRLQSDLLEDGEDPEGKELLGEHVERLNIDIVNIDAGKTAILK